MDARIGSAPYWYAYHPYTSLYQRTDRYACPIAAVTAFIALLSTHSMRVAFKGHSVVLSMVSLAMVLATLAVDIAFGVINGRTIQGNALFNAFFIFDLGTPSSSTGSPGSQCCLF